MTSVIELEIIVIASLAAITCTIPGSMIALRKNPYMADVASKCLVLGASIGLAFSWFTPDWVVLLLGACSALLGVWLLNKVSSKKIIDKNSASAIFPAVMLSLGVLIINNFTDISHAHISTVMAGELAYLPFDRVTAYGYDIGPTTIYLLVATLFINIICVWLFYKDIKISTIDEGYARTSQMHPNAVYILLGCMAAVTVAVSFRVVGAFMATAFLLAPALTARFYAKRLSVMIAASIIICITACLTGFSLAYKTNILISGSIVCVMGVFFLITVITAPETGIIRILSDKRKHRFTFAIKILTVHLYLRDTSKVEGKTTVESLKNTLGWKTRFTEQVTARLIYDGLAAFENNEIILTDKGGNFALTAIKGN